MDSAAILLAFAAQWSHPDYPPIRVVRSELEIAERTLGVRFPEDYRVGILSAGLPYPTGALLTAVVDRDVQLHALSQLAAPFEIVEETLDCREIGMPENLIVIGSDAGGSKFCFDHTDIQGDSVKSAPVYFWDHDFDTVELVAASFQDWIGSHTGGWSAGLTYKDF